MNTCALYQRVSHCGRSAARVWVRRQTFSNNRAVTSEHKKNDNDFVRALEGSPTRIRKKLQRQCVSKENSLSAVLTIEKVSHKSHRQAKPCENGRTLIVKLQNHQKSRHFLSCRGSLGQQPSRKLRRNDAQDTLILTGESHCFLFC